MAVDWWGWLIIALSAWLVGLLTLVVVLAVIAAGREILPPKGGGDQ